MKIIGLAGPKRSGKDTTCFAIKTVLEPEHTVRRVAFADPMKAYIADVLGAPEGSDFIEWCNSLKSDGGAVIYPDNNYMHSYHLDGRTLIQNVGTMARKHFGVGFWVDKVLPASKLKLEGLYGEVDYLVVADVRMANEASRIHQLGGEVWRVHRDGVEYSEHVSERQLYDEVIDRVVENSGTPEDLYHAVKAALA